MGALSSQNGLPDQDPNTNGAANHSDNGETKIPAIKVVCSWIVLVFCVGLVWWGLAGCAITLDLCRSLSGIVGYLPWNWRACLHDGQEHSQRKSFHGGKIVSLRGMEPTLA
jgi:hypothetical protein